MNSEVPIYTKIIPGLQSGQTKLGILSRLQTTGQCDGMTDIGLRTLSES